MASKMKAGGPEYDKFTKLAMRGRRYCSIGKTLLRRMNCLVMHWTNPFLILAFSKVLLKLRLPLAAPPPNRGARADPGLQSNSYSK